MSANAADIAKIPTSEKERAAYIKDAFQKIDVNRDGKIDMAEWSTFMQSFTKSQDNAFNQAFTAADVDRDGQLSKAEATKANVGLAIQHPQICVQGRPGSVLQPVRECSR